LIGAHALWAGFSGVPELAMDEPTSKEYVKRLEAVARHYDIKTTQKSIDIAACAIFAIGVEAPRIGLFLNSRRAKPPRTVPEYGVERNPDGSTVLRPAAFVGPSPFGEGAIDGEFDVN
jgi:hypothetical protein